MSTGCKSGSRSLLLVFFFSFSRPLNFPVTQSYLISWTATWEEDPRVNANQSCGTAASRAWRSLRDDRRPGQHCDRKPALTGSDMKGMKCEFVSEVTLWSVECQEGLWFTRRWTVSCNRFMLASTTIFNFVFVTNNLAFLPVWRVAQLLKTNTGMCSKRQILLENPLSSMFLLFSIFNSKFVKDQFKSSLN